MKKQSPGSMEEIEMSLRFGWANQNQTPPAMEISQIPKDIIDCVYRLFREDFSSKSKRKMRERSKIIIYINPLALQTGIWNLVLIFVAYFLEVQISLTLGFGSHFWISEIQQPIYYIGYICLLVLLLVDIFINFHKGYYAFGYGKVIDDRQLIAKNYLKSYFSFDVICIIILGIPLLHSSFGTNYLQLIPTVLLFVKKFKCQKQITQALQYQTNLRIAFILFMLGCDVMLLGNFGACIFLGIDLLLWSIQFFGNNPQYYWLSNNSSYSVDLINGPWIAQYVYAQSFSTGTLSTLAPGPFGKNPIQITYELFVMIFFMILASYVGEVLISLLYTAVETRIFHENNIQKFDSFMSLKGVANFIKLRVQNFFQLVWEFQVKINAQKQQEIIKSMPIKLQQDLIVQMRFGKQLSFINFFRMEYDIQKLISLKIVSNIVDPGATIFEVGAPDDTLGEDFIYYIKNGLAKFYFPFHKQQKVLALSNVERVLGQYEFVTGLSFAFCCKSIDLCMIQKISATDLRDILKSLNLIEDLHVLKCKMMVYDELRWINKTCIICDNYHRENACPQLMIKQRIRISLFKQNQFQQRIKIETDRTQFNRSSHEANRKIYKYQQKKQISSKISIQNLHEFIVNQSLHAQGQEVASFVRYYPQFNMYD